jgi:hypothetical protein
VTFSNGSTALGTAQLTSGTATLTTSSLPTGTYSVTALYGGDATFGGSSSTAVGLMVVDLTLTPAQSSLAVTRGQIAQTTLTVTPAPLANFNPTVSFACSGLPAESTCAFKPPSVALNGAAGTTTLTIQTTAPSARLQRGYGGSGLFYAVFLPSLMSIVFWNKNYRRELTGNVRILALACLMLSTAWWTACGGASMGTSGGTNSNPGTPTGSNNIIITATSSGATPIAKQVTITLDVR